MSRRVRRVLVAAMIMVIGVAAFPAFAGALGVNEVARELRCPTCNSPLDTSQSPVANDMKEFIAERIADGWGKQRIIDAMVERFGQDILATPPKSGFNLIAWVVPALVLIAGIILVPWLTRLWASRGGGDVREEVPEVSAAERALIDEELRRRNL